MWFFCYYSRRYRRITDIKNIKVVFFFQFVENKKIY